MDEIREIIDKTEQSKKTNTIKAQAYNKIKKIVDQYDSDVETGSSDSDYEPDSASDEDDRHAVRDIVNMGGKAEFPISHLDTHFNHFFPKTSNVIELSDTSIHAMLFPCVIMFFVNWCPHCKEMKPEFEKASKASNLHFYALDCEKYKKVASAYGITGYPTIMYKQNMKQHELYNLNLGNTAPKLLQWFHTKEKKKVMDKIVRHFGMKQFSGVSFYERSKVRDVTPEELNAVSENEAVFTEFYAPWCGHCKDAKPIMMELANQIPVYALNGDLYSNEANEYGAQGFPTFGMVQNGKIIKKYQGDRSVESFVDFVRVKEPDTFFGNSKVKDCSPEELNKLSELKTMLTMFYAPWCGHCVTAKEVMKELSEKIDICALNSEKYPDEAKRVGITGYPSIVAYKNGQMVTKHTGPRTAEGIMAFYNEHVKESPNSSDSDSFFGNSKVMDCNPEQLANLIQTKKMLVMFYAPWCGHCVQSKEIIKKVSEQIDTCALNADKYQEAAQQYNVEGFPTIRKYENGNHQEYEGPRDVESIVNFYNQ